MINNNSLHQVKKDKITISLDTEYGSTTFSCEEDNLCCIDELLMVFTRFLKAADFNPKGNLEFIKDIK